MTEYYNPKKEQRERLIKTINEGFNYLLMNPNMDEKFRPDVKKIYTMYQKLVRMIEVEK